MWYFKDNITYIVSIRSRKTCGCRKRFRNMYIRHKQFVSGNSFTFNRTPYSSVYYCERSQIFCFRYNTT